MEGVGAHSGNLCSISIMPAETDNGITYVTKENSVITANYRNVTDTKMCTCISNSQGACVSLVEHLSAAFYGLGVSNAVVHMNDCSEIPIMDGSALPFVNAIISVGLQKQSASRKKIRILKNVKVGDEKRYAELSPVDPCADSLIISVTCDYSARNLVAEPFSFDESKDNFIEDIAPARTFGFFADVEYLRKHNLAKGSSLENAVVFDNDGKVMNEDGLRYHNEHVRHKILDVIGDLSLTQYKVVGKYDGFCPGHAINNILLLTLFGDSSNFDIE
jgi:UDP-3-O-[3-hydroxymyristoyl] N-acetylglucosamine deacetylase